MSDDTNDGKIVDLSVYRRAVSKQEVASKRTTKAQIVADQLQFSFDGGRTWHAFDDRNIEWLHSWVMEFRRRRRDENKRDEHRCYRCNLVIGIECRGHRSSEARTHYQVEVLERRKRWKTRIYQAGSNDLLAELLSSKPVVHRDELEEYASAVRSACGRRVAGNSSTPKWDEVDCYNCLKRKPRIVP
jgi:hypothetical protein